MASSVDVWLLMAIIFLRLRTAGTSFTASWEKREREMEGNSYQLLHDGRYLWFHGSSPYLQSRERTAVAGSSFKPVHRSLPRLSILAISLHTTQHTHCHIVANSLQSFAQVGRCICTCVSYTLMYSEEYFTLRTSRKLTVCPRL